MTMSDNQRSDQWHEIWARKFARRDVPLHHLDGFDLLSEEQWSALVHCFKKLVAPVEGKDMMEVGCGAGAFLQYFTDARSLSGIDYIEDAIETINKHIEGDFRCAAADILPFADASCDIALSFGVFFYFDDLDYASRALDQMLRCLRPDGSIFLFDVNDAAKKALYEHVRSLENRGKIEQSSTKTTHLFYPKEFFIDYANSRNLDVEIVDEDTLDIPFHSGVQYRYYVKLSPRG